MTEAELIAAGYLNDPGYQNFRNWYAAGAKHGSYAGMMPNEAVVRSSETPWGENIQYDAAGNQVSMWRAPRPGEVSPYGGNVPPGSGGPSAPGPPAAGAANPTTQAIIAALGTVPGWGSDLSQSGLGVSWTPTPAASFHSRAPVLPPPVAAPVSLQTELANRLAQWKKGVTPRASGARIAI